MINKVTSGSELPSITEEAIARLHIVIEMVEVFSESLPPDRQPDKRSGYEFSVIQEVLKDVADGLQAGLDAYDAEPPKADGGAR